MSKEPGAIQAGLPASLLWRPRKQVLCRGEGSTEGRRQEKTGGASQSEDPVRQVLGGSPRQDCRASTTSAVRRAAPAGSCFRDDFLHAGKVTERLSVWGTGAFADWGLYGATYCRVFNKSCPRAFEAGYVDALPGPGVPRLAGQPRPRREGPVALNGDGLSIERGPGGRKYLDLAGQNIGQAREMLLRSFAQNSTYRHRTTTRKGCAGGDG